MEQDIKTTTDIILEESQAMAEYLALEGESIPGNVLYLLEILKKQQGNLDVENSVLEKQLEALSQAHDYLTETVAPASPKTIFLMWREKQKRSFFYFISPIPLVRNMIAVCLLSLFILIMTSLSSYIGHTGKEGEPSSSSIIDVNMYNANGIKLLVNLIFLLAASAIGATFSILSKVKRYVITMTYDPKYATDYWSQFFLGLMGGLILTQFLPQETLNGIEGLTVPMLALLGGFSANLVYGLLNRMSETIEKMVSSEKGSVGKKNGDGIMASSTKPTALEVPTSGTIPSDSEKKTSINNEDSETISEKKKEKVSSKSLEEKKTSYEVRYVSLPVAHVWKQPSTDSTKLGSLQEGDKVEYDLKQDGWLRVFWNGHKGWMRENLLREEAKASESSQETNDNQKVAPDTSGKERSSTLIEPSKSSKNASQKESKQTHSESKKLPEKTSSRQNKETTEYLYQDKELQECKLEANVSFSVSGNKIEKQVSETWNLFGGVLEKLCQRTGLENGMAVAVLCVESGGKGFGTDGRPIIRFENHWMWNLWGKENAVEFGKYFKFNQKEKWKGHVYRKSEEDEWRSFHGAQTKEWDVLELARSLDNNAALQSISMGAPQVMGFNHKKIGYKNVTDMFRNFNQDIRYHIFALFDFLDEEMKQSLRKKNFKEFAKRYNGPGQASQYGEWIEQRYQIFQEIEQKS